MGRTRGSLNNSLIVVSPLLAMTVEERIQCIATLILDTIEAQQRTRVEINKEFRE
jgi:hypothetical protein